MHALSQIGCRFTIDDFGSGLSSFSYLRKLPIDFLKIDGLLVKDILDDPTDFTLVKSINEISKSMGKRTVAEFIESPRLLNAVRDIGIDFAQGFHIGAPELIDNVS
jgi:EAL domain-containing protein (putative c-di-GMP-specific phosphodiesterase class I)